MGKTYSDPVTLYLKSPSGEKWESMMGSPEPSKNVSKRLQCLNDKKYNILQIAIRDHPDLSQCYVASYLPFQVTKK
jgi:hypothetical protein